MFSVLASFVSEWDKLMHLTKIQNITQVSCPLTLLIFPYFSSILLILCFLEYFPDIYKLLFIQYRSVKADPITL